MLFGEYVSNSRLFNDKEFDIFNAFGAFIKPAFDQSAKEVCEKMQAKGYATSIREDDKIMLTMNKALKQLLDKPGLSTVPFLDKYENFHSLLLDDRYWMYNLHPHLAKGDWTLDGQDEKLVFMQNLAFSNFGWLAEKDFYNLGMVRDFLDEIEPD